MMPRLIPEQDQVMGMLKKTGAFREGHFVYPSGQHTPHYFQMPLAFRYYDTARVLAVALSRKLRLEKDISSALPKVSIISPSPGGIPVAFAVREALNAEQIYWAEREEGKRMFRQYVNAGEVHPCVIVDDISRTGKALQETVDIVQQLGAKVIGCGVIVRFQARPPNSKSPTTTPCPSSPSSTSTPSGTTPATPAPSAKRARPKSTSVLKAVKSSEPVKVEEAGRLHSLPVTLRLDGLRLYISCRLVSALSIVTSSTYSRSEPTGMPIAMRVTRTPSGFRRRLT